MIGALVQVAGMVSDTNREPSPPSGNRRSGVLGGQSQFAARPIRWSDLDRLLELADGPAPCQISIPEPALIEDTRSDEANWALGDHKTRGRSLATHPS